MSRLVYRGPCSRVLAAAAAGTLFMLMSGSLLVGATSAAAAPGLSYVSAAAKSNGADTSCSSAKYSSISTAIEAASAGSTVVVCSGTYKGDVTVIKPIVLSGEHATIDATNADNGVTVPVGGATVEGFTVKGAIGEGILVVGKPGAPVSGVTIKNNTVEGNDLGNPTGGPIKTSSYKECNEGPPPGLVPGDCGEGIHLMVATNSVVSDNTVTGNAGGILLTDEFGPNDHNLVENNTITNNVLDCGITLASHSTTAVAGGKAVPAKGGIYDDTIENNTLRGNGTKGQGAGVLLAAAAPGGATYDNTVKGNSITGDGLAGVTMHSHAPNQDLNGNVIENNTIGKNNLDGDKDFKPHVDLKTTGVIVATAVSPISITISNNKISNNGYGIWQTGKVTVTGLSTNSFSSVGTKNLTG